MKFWLYYAIAAVSLLHPHLSQKIEMLIDYFSHPEYEFWTTFSLMDFSDLMLHAGLPILFIIFGIRKQRKTKNDN